MPRRREDIRCSNSLYRSRFSNHWPILIPLRSGESQEAPVSCCPKGTENHAVQRYREGTQSIPWTSTNTDSCVTAQICVNRPIPKRSNVRLSCSNSWSRSILWVWPTENKQWSLGVHDTTTLHCWFGELRAQDESFGVSSNKADATAEDISNVIQQRDQRTRIKFVKIEPEGNCQ